MSSIVQSIVIPKSKMNLGEATEWVHNNYKLHKIDETTNEYRFRQIDPKTLERKGYTRYSTKTLSNGAMLVLAFLK